MIGSSGVLVVLRNREHIWQKNMTRTNRHLGMAAVLPSAEMKTHTMEVTEAILAEVRSLNRQPDEAINLLEIGPALVDAGFSQHSIVNGLFSLQTRKVIELLPGNRLRIVKFV